MKALLQLEELAKLVLAYLASLSLGFTWWAFLVFLLAPDLSMLGYLANSRVGAWLYNLFHHQGVAIAVGILGVVMAQPPLQLAGLVLFGHSAMDRAFGYGLKYEDGFKHTHLGWIGKSSRQIQS
jgi:hypothetical protein